MKNLLVTLLCLAIINVSSFANIKVLSVKGKVLVRHGIQEQWYPISVGDILKPEDSIELGKKSSISLLIDGTKKISIADYAIIDLSDLRTLTQEELLLKLAMAKVRDIPNRQKDDKINIPRTTTVYGSKINNIPNSESINQEIGLMRLNGTKILYDLGYYATCVLKAKEVFRLFPDLSKKFEMRLMIADALEKMKLNGEALDEYILLLGEELSDINRNFIEKKIENLKKKN